MQAPQTQERFINRLAMLIGSTYIIWFFSEMFFFNEGEGFYIYSSLSGIVDVAQFLADLLLNVVFFYGGFTLWLLMPIHLFRVRSLWALILAGALCGWAIEGILPIMYAEMPVALLWPAASWHIVINVILGWFLLRKLLEQNKHGLTLAAFAVLGLFWGFWGTWFWPLEGTGTVEALNAPLTVGEFAFFTFTSSFFLFLGYLLVDRFGKTTFTPRKWEVWAWIVLSVLALIFLAQLYALIFCALVGFVMLILSRNRRYETRPPVFSVFSPGIKFTNLLLVFAMPIAANLTYPIYLANDVSANASVGVILTPLVLLSTGLLITSVIMILRMRRNNATANHAPHVRRH